jgi:NDP-sugar pyrophosphorylase family protein
VRGEERLEGVTAVILAGGLGTRLRERVPDRPKVLAEVGGRPFLAWILDRLAGAGVRTAVLCTGYRGEEVEAALGDRHGPLRLRYSREVTPLGTAGALGLARALFESDPVLVQNGDSYCVADLGQLARAHRDRGAAGTVLLAEVPDAGRFGSVELQADGAVAAFREKGSRGRCWVNAGTYLLGAELLRSIPPGARASLERDILPSWVGRGLYGHRAGGPFIDIGTPESYAAAERFFRELST